MENVIFPRKLLKKFILLYKKMPCLWDRSCPAYRHKQIRHDAVSKLTALVQEYDPSATRVHVLRKIESLRACIRREHKRVVQSRAVATSVDELYVPQLWYYDLFSFVFGEDANNTVKARSPEQAAVSYLPMVFHRWRALRCHSKRHSDIIIFGLQFKVGI